MKILTDLLELGVALVAMGAVSLGVFVALALLTFALTRPKDPDKL